MVLNRDYYKQLWEKYKPVKSIIEKHNSNSITLSIKLLLDSLKQGKHLHLNFQNSITRLNDIGRNLFVELANDIFINHYDLPKDFKKGNRIKKIGTNKYFTIDTINNNRFSIVEANRNNESSPATFGGIPYETLVKNYYTVDSGVKDKTIKACFDFFEKLNSEKIDFPRINFEQKVVFIAKKTFWDSISEKQKIPSIYLPNPRDEEHKSEIRTIPALSSCTVYFSPKYEVCYQHLLKKDEKIKTIVIFDTEIDKLNQIMQDQLKYKFNLLVLTNSSSPTKFELLPCWNWFNEELSIIDSI